ncbi:MAG: patatin-like phospholipase family protein [Duncaniella sp.]|nr:patatin-like phospholipase family protein [Duncaniella sp.]
MLNVFKFSFKPYRLGLALSGGGARGFAHAGALQAFEEMHIRPDVIAGVSAGSVVTVLYAAGLTPIQILEAFATAKFTDFAKFGMPNGGFFNMDGFKNFLKENLRTYKNIEELPIPSIVCATDLDQGLPVAFYDGEITERVAASCSIPIVFKPVKIDGHTYVDGGVLHNLPAWALRDKCKYVIGVNCSPVPDRGPADSIMEVAQRTYDIMVKSNARADMKLCDLAITIDDIATYKVFSLAQIERVFRIGYETTMRELIKVGFRK